MVEIPTPTMASSAISAAVISAVLSGIISYFVSRKTATSQVRTQFEYQNMQKRKEWYEQAISLANRAEDDWWDAMGSGEKEYKVDAQSIFLERRDELREHAAKGEGLGVDVEVIVDLQGASDCFSQAANDLNSGADLATIEKKHLLPALDAVIEKSKEKEPIPANSDDGKIQSFLSNSLSLS